MKQTRFDGLSDGIFAIILTLLTFELKIPHLSSGASDLDLWKAMLTLWPVFLSFMLSFALIFTYWHAHHFIASIYARNVDRRLTSINALFFFFVALIPFSTNLLNSYTSSRLAVIVYSLNIIAIGFALLWMRGYVLSSGHIDHAFVTRSEKQRGLIRVLAPMIFAVIAIIVCFFSTSWAFILLTLAIIFNLVSRSTRLINWIIIKTRQEIAG